MLLSKGNSFIGSAKLCFSTCSMTLSARLEQRETVYYPVTRTPLKSPVDHTKDHVGMWYTIDPEKRAQILGLGLSNRYEAMTVVFRETALMIREPAISVMKYIKNSNLDLSPNKFIFYGDRGIGKTLCLAHIVHFLSDDEWILVHLPQPNKWITHPLEILNSLSREKQYDHTMDGSAWLKHFRLQNASLLEKLGLLTKEKFVWTQREVTEEGSSLLSFIDNGISRARYSSECIHFLMRQLKEYANEGRCKVGCVVEGINCFFTPLSKHRRSDRSFVELENMTLFRAFSQLFANDWKNGVIVGSTDYRCSPSDRRDSILPRYLLRKKGWEALEPFVPIEIKNYSDIELNSVFNYYHDRNFFLLDQTHSDVAKAEMEFNTQKNPLLILTHAQSK